MGCEKGFKWKCSLTEHLKIHSGERPYICSVCNKSFSHNGNRNTHMKTHKTCAESKSHCDEAIDLPTISPSYKSHPSAAVNHRVNDTCLPTSRSANIDNL